eukprot:CAMPEP_0197195256 /NCGR_PEP_ID=MMETSP1423-20130617/30736_1 /TAXON_ID=476441 /ORGANISM="Pseudo-nitzschia heimii, Strain UNC1101" /LENGTH=339 /DNA_ID=CAMNT_0042648845 /DNA_START=125 /DNA_END=1144 /DNA_ORIENTATION=+
MAPPPSNNDQGKEEGNDNDDRDPPAPSSWFGSWFERDLRNEIHEQLNDFDEREQRYEEAQEERRRFFEQHASSSFPFFFPPGNDDRFGPPRSDDLTRSKTNGHNGDEFDDFFGGFPRARWQGGFVGDESEDGRRSRSRSDGPFENEGNAHRSQAQRDRGVKDFHREMQSLIETAFAGGMIPPSHESGHHRGAGDRGWTSSSSTTVVSNSNGTSYKMKQDSKNGARVDLSLPKSCPSEKVWVEVLQERPCLFRWRNKDAEDGGATSSSTHRNHQLGQVLELGDSVDCSKLSASISKARQTLTVEAPPIGRRINSEEDPSSLSQFQQPHAHPRPVPVTKKS